MSHNFEESLTEILRLVALEPASEAMRLYQISSEEERKQGQADRLLLRSHEAADQLAISSATLDRLTRSGDLTCVRVGPSVRYSVETLREWIREKEQEKGGT